MCFESDEDMTLMSGFLLKNPNGLRIDVWRVDSMEKSEVA